MEAPTVASLIEGLVGEGERVGHTYVTARGDVHRSYAELVGDARSFGAALLAAGLRRGDAVGLILPEADAFIPCFLGCLRAGIIAVPLYPPLAFGRLDAYLASTSRMLGAAGARYVVTTGAIRRLLYTLVDSAALADVLDVDSLFSSSVAGARGALPDAAAVAPDDTAFLQFTSGSTDAPKGVRVTHGGLVANARAIMIGALRATRDDKPVSWLPLYHDMGLIGFVVAPLVTRSPTTFLSTVEFLRRPASWMETIARVGGTITFAPNFAFALAVRKSDGAGVAALDLSRLRVVGCGAEPIHAETLRAFARHFAPAGLAADAITPCYGAAEATLAMSFAGPGWSPLRVDRIAREPYHAQSRAVPAAHEDADGIEIVCCGTAVDGHTLRIVGERGEALPDRHIGEIAFRGASVAGGYWQNPSASARAFVDGELRTGDLGYLADGALYVTGRKKDLIILNGRNYDPQSIERAAVVDGVRPGNVVAFSRPAAETEELVVVAEVRAGVAPGERAALRVAVERAVRATLSIAVADVVLVDAGTLPKTSSGKLQRTKARAQYLAAALGREGVRTVGNVALNVALLRQLGRSAWARVRRLVRGPDDDAAPAPPAPAA